jgi:putative transcriptional regulator
MIFPDAFLTSPESMNGVPGLSTLPFSSSPAPHKDGGYLDGHVLVAMPSMPNERFARSVVYVCSHSAEGAMGIVLNRPAPNIRFHDLLIQLDILPSAEAILLPQNDILVLRGGPVETGRGFVLHSGDMTITHSSLTIDGQIYLTATLDILKAIAQGRGPQRAVLALGYAGWGPGQLDSEISNNGWLHCPADPDLVFDSSFEDKYARALRKLGVDPVYLSASAGHA